MARKSYKLSQVECLITAAIAWELGIDVVSESDNETIVDMMDTMSSIEVNELLDRYEQAE